MTRFDPRRLRPDGTLNGTRLTALPGADPALVGRYGGDVLSRDALVGLTVDAAAGRLAHLIATLRQPDETATPWRQAYLRYWSRVQCVWLGGGVAASLGAGLAVSTARELKRLRCPVDVRLAEHALLLPLIGAARTPPLGRRCVVLDFGQSTVKRGVASYAEGALLHLRVLPPISAPAYGSKEVLTLARGVIRDTRAEAAPAEPRIVASIACYVRRGRPLDLRSTYAPLARLRLSEIAPGLTFVHDGTAAARAIETRVPAAVIMLGTYLGVGLPPVNGRGLVPL